MTIRIPLLFAALIAAAAGSWILARDDAFDGDDAGIVRASSSGYYVRDATVRGIGEDGRFLYAIEAAEAAESADTGMIELKQVAIRYRAEDDIPWHIRALRGRISDDLSIVELSGEVVVESLGERSASLSTERLTFDPSSYVARTDARVVIEVGERSISATGMLAFLDEDRIELKSNVRGRFLP